MSLADLINERANLESKIADIIKSGINTIDRILWTIDEEPYTDYNSPIPETFNITSYRLRDNRLVIYWATYFRGEVDENGGFEIPVIYFDDPTAYEEALTLAKTKQAEKIAQEQAMERLREAETAEQTRIHEAELLEVLLAKRERGDI